MPVINFCSRNAVGVVFFCLQPVLPNWTLDFSSRLQSRPRKIFSEALKKENKTRDTFSTYNFTVLLRKHSDFRSVFSVVVGYLLLLICCHMSILDEFLFLFFY